MYCSRGGGGGGENGNLGNEKGDGKKNSESLVAKIQLCVEVLIATTEVETWPALHRRNWEDHCLFLTATCKEDEWVEVPPETKKDN